MDKSAKTPRRLLIAARKERLWSQQDLASLLGTTQHNISRWEQSTTTPSPYFSKKLCELFGKSAQELGLLGEPINEAQFPIQTPSSAPASLPSIAEQNPPHWHVPYPRNPFFTGRDDVLHHVHAALHPESPVNLSQSYALSGLGGIGKTQVAIEYAYRYADNYSAVFWIGAETTEQVISSFVALAHLLNLPEKDERERQHAVTAVTRWLNRYSGWLLIFDNVEAVEIVKQFVPATRHGSLLFTTRSQALGISAYTRDLAKMAPDEGVRFLLHRARVLPTTASSASLSPQDEAAAREIVTAMDGLPLALDQAGAYIEETHCGLSTYLHFFQKQPMQLLQQSDRASTYPRSVAQTFTLALECIAQRNPLAIEVLTFCSFLAPDAIPEEFLTEIPDLSGTAGTSFAAEPLLFQDVFRDLLAYSLIHRNPAEKTISLHRLVQAVLQDTLSKETKETWVPRIIQAVDRALPAGAVPENWLRYNLALPHVEVCARLIMQGDLFFHEAGALLTKGADYLLALARYALAETYVTRAQTIFQQLFGPEHSEIAKLLFLRANLAEVQGNYTQAEALCQQSLQMGKHLPNPDHFAAAKTLTILANVFTEQGRYVEAEAAYQEALQKHNLFGPEHYEVAHTLNNLAWLLRELGRFSEAETLFLRARDLYEQILGAEHPRVALAIDNLASLYLHMSRFTEARPLLQYALDIREKVFGAEHPHVAYSLNAMAHFFFLQGQYALALPLSQRALAIDMKLLGEEHSDVATDLNNVATEHMGLGQYQEAGRLFQQAQNIYEKAFGVEHAYVAAVLHNQAKLLLSLDRVAEAETYGQRALVIMEQAFGRKHPRTALILNTVGRIALEQGHVAQAEAFLQEALDIQEQILGKEHLHIAQSCTGLARLYSEQEAYTRAEPLYQRALRIVEKQASSEHPDATDAFQGLAYLAAVQKRYDEAEALYKRTLRIREQRLGPDHPLTAEALRGLASLSIAQGKESDAIPLLQRALAICEHSLGASHKKTEEIQTHYHDLLRVLSEK